MDYIFNFNNEKISIKNSWAPVFKELEKELKNIEKYIGNEYTPETSNIFKVFQCLSPDKIKVIILGQDPYSQQGVATGRAFEVNNYNNWQNPSPNVSLTNIFKKLYREHIDSKKEIKEINIKSIRGEINDKQLKILPPCELFVNWEENGVLLLNTALTCEIDKPDSHSIYWICFTKKIIEFIASNNNFKHWLLWGNKAQQFEKLINDKSNNKIIKVTHPRNNEFVGSSTFSEVKNYCKLFNNND